MAAVNEKVMRMVREEIEKNPSVKADELYQKAKQIDKKIARLKLRQFHARYPLQVRRIRAGTRRRRRAAARGRPPGRAARGRPRRAAASFDRDAARTLLLQFAHEVAAAEDRAALVDVIGGVDKVLDRLARAAGAA
ncbi:MAG: hypothetical protein HY561_00550 [Gemmatimonadetes bacterium]|nr:hypothetical protein [Gemmatimonadota bacterium]